MWIGCTAAPPYSPALAPSNFYLLPSLQKCLDDKTFTSNEEVKNHLDQFFASKEQTRYGRGIMWLPERWQKVLDENTILIEKKTCTNIKNNEPVPIKLAEI